MNLCAKPNGISLAWCANERIFSLCIRLYILGGDAIFIYFKGAAMTIDDLSHENSLIRARNERLEAEKVELVALLLTIVDNDFSYGPEIGDIRSRFRSDAMQIIRTARVLIEKHTGSAT